MGKAGACSNIEGNDLGKRERETAKQMGKLKTHESESRDEVTEKEN